MTAAPDEILCFTCRENPAGWGQWHQYSAYCRNGTPVSGPQPAAGVWEPDRTCKERLRRRYAMGYAAT
jgi:hypothetical protein